MGVTCGQLDMRSFLNMFHPYPCPHTFFTSRSSLLSSKFKKKFFTVLVDYKHKLVSSTKSSLVIVVSSLIALMVDQVRSLKPTIHEATFVAGDTQHCCL